MLVPVTDPALYLKAQSLVRRVGPPGSYLPSPLCVKHYPHQAWGSRHTPTCSLSQARVFLTSTNSRLLRQDGVVALLRGDEAEAALEPHPVAVPLARHDLAPLAHAADEGSRIRRGVHLGASAGYDLPAPHWHCPGLRRGLRGHADDLRRHQIPGILLGLQGSAEAPAQPLPQADAAEGRAHPQGDREAEQDPEGGEPALEVPRGGDAAVHAHVFAVDAVVRAPAAVRALGEVALRARAPQVVQPDRSRARRHLAAPEHEAARLVPELAADDARVALAEGVVADGAPLPQEPDLQAAAVALRQPDVDGALGAGLVADERDVLGVAAIVPAPAGVRAREEVGLPACALHFVQPDRPRAWGAHVTSTSGVPQLPTDHTSGLLIKAVVADGAPLPVVVHFKTAAITACQSNVSGVCGLCNCTSNEQQQTADGAHLCRHSPIVHSQEGMSYP
mmetsp:Transcript_13802/g.27904  ORF Transcript_13802/g.27904 Transcript_13802/m.27904 type:complete len:448 (+) Transcript_13802:89-1432(+)